MTPLDEPRVVGLFQLADGEPTGDPPRTWIQVMIAGEFKHPKHGKFTITDDDLEAYAADIQERADQILIDFDHDSAYGNTKAAGWYTGQTEIKPDGHGRPALFAEIELTPSGAAAVRSKEYRFISPEFSKTFRDAEGKLVKKVRMWATALTNRPFLPEMEPVTLSDIALADIVWAPDEGWRQLERKVHEALNPGPLESARYWVMDLTSEKALVQEYRTGKTWVVPYTLADGGEVTVAPAGDWAEAEQEWVQTATAALTANGPRRPFALPASAEEPLALARWSTAFINDLPDSSFLHVEAGGEKDDDGKTTPRSLRHFPVKDADGNIDLPHVRNAIARAPQSNLPQTVKNRVQAAARRLLQRAGGTTTSDDPESTKLTNGKDEPVDPQILALLELPEHADTNTILAAIRERDEKIAELEEKITGLSSDAANSAKLAKEVADLKKRDREREIDAILREEVTAGRVLPAEVAALSDQFADNPDGLKTLVNTRPPGLFADRMRERGHGGARPGGQTDPSISRLEREFQASDPIDEESGKLHLAALDILRERGKGGDYTRDDYLNALDEAQRALSFS